MNCDLSLQARVVAFADIVNRCEFTNRERLRLPLEEGMSVLCDRLGQLRKSGNSLYLIGNGGSAGVAGHSATDFFNVARLRATTLHESSLMTCMANDFGYENAFARMLKQMARADDVVVAISSSGKSMNIRSAAAEAASAGAYVVTLSGFAHDNPLRFLGDLNIWLDSTDYGHVEIGHQFILHNVSDRFGAGLVE